MIDLATMDYKDLSLNDLLKIWQDAVNSTKANKEKLISARKAYIEDCQERERVFANEKNRLEKEISEKEREIKKYSAEYAGLLRSGKDLSGIKAEITKATQARDEAKATLTALSDVEIEYDQDLYNAVLEAETPVKEDKGKLNILANDLMTLRERIEKGFLFDSEVLSPIRYREDNTGLVDPYLNEWNRRK